LSADVLNSQIVIDSGYDEGPQILSNFKQMVKDFSNKER